jgi:putative methionine-R-sulfoxide reductase with GAF domain
MKKTAENLLKFLVIAVAVAAVFAALKTEKSWWLPAVFSFNFCIIAGFIVIGPVVSAILMSAALLLNGFMILKAIGAKISILPFIIEGVIFAVSYILVKQASDANNYLLFNAQDEVKVLEGNYNALIKEEELLKTGIEANREKLEKYAKLKNIHEGLSEHNMFAGKMRYILRNIISVFHQEKEIVLFFIKDGRFMKIEASKDDDIFVGEPDQESLFLKNFDEWIIKNKKSVLIADMHKEIRFKRSENDRLRSLIAVPVFCGEEIAGVLRISSEKSECFNQEDLRFLDLIAEMTGKILKEEAANAQ